MVHSLKRPEYSVVRVDSLASPSMEQLAGLEQLATNSFVFAEQSAPATLVRPYA